MSDPNGRLGDQSAPDPAPDAANGDQPEPTRPLPPSSESSAGSPPYPDAHESPPYPDAQQQPPSSPYGHPTGHHPPHAAPQAHQPSGAWYPQYPVPGRPPPWGGARTSPYPPPAGAGRHLPPHQRASRSGNPIGLVLTGLVALVVGLVGGLVGALAVVNSDDESAGPGLLADGNDVPPPLPNGRSVAGVADATLPSVVQIVADGDSLESSGSGFVVDDERHIITNNHVIAEAADGGRITVVFNDETRVRASVVGSSPAYDIAVLEFEDSTVDNQPVALARNRLRVGETVVAIGAPLGLSSSVTSGIVSAVDRPVTVGSQDDESSYINAIQTDAAINPGNSGGPLVNMRGEVIGVNSAIATVGFGGGGGSIGVGFAIPIDQVLRTADQILADGEASYPIVGATVETGRTLDGATLAEVTRSGPADEAGLQDGDVVTRLDGDRITDGIELIVAIRSHLPGDEITVRYRRDGEARTTTITLDKRVG
ncbi:MAG: PDZ domain-containing protein [Propionibacteriales bacterium]|nr:PDZ domain-containing protein [Propionibacteriales bacterium]